MIKRFKVINMQDIITCGGKGSSLGEMTQAGFPVPNGFVLTTNAFGIEHNKRADEVLHAFDLLNSKFVAVRSSGTKEDGIDDSFAGQFDTYLFVTRENLIEQIMECHKSINSDRISSYCESKNIDKSQIKVAVVIQKMINSESAGVCFTVNPVTGNIDEIMMEAGRGVGEAVVSGMITPDNYIVNKISNKVSKTISIQDKKLILNLQKGGIKEVQLEETEKNIQKLSDKHISELAELANKIANHYEKPMDIERAVEDGKLYLLQARPVTSIENKTMGLDIIKKFIIDNKDHKLRPAMANVSPFLRSTRNKQYRFDKFYEDRTKFNTLIIINKDKSLGCINEDKLFAIGKEMFYRSFFELDLIENRSAILKQAIVEIDTMYSKYSYEKISQLKENEIVNIISEVKEFIWNINGALQFCSMFDKNIAKETLQKLGKYPGDNLFEEIRELGISVFDFSFEMDGAVYLAKEKIGDKSYEEIVEKGQFILASYGNVPTVSETKKYIDEHFSFLASREETELFIKDAIADYNFKKNHFENKLKEIQDHDIRHIAQYIQTIITLRDKRKNFFNKGFVIMWRCAERLFSDINFDKKYIQYLLASEFSEGTQYLNSIKENIIKREDGYVVYVPYDGDIMFGMGAVDQCVEYLNSKGYSKEYNKDCNEIHGDCGNKGFIVGEIQVIKDKNMFENFKPGNILVTGMTRPEYIPLMKIASAIITDEGGITCHAAIVSREMGKPCIIGTKFGTKILKDGDIVEVDADNGVIRMITK